MDTIQEVIYSLWISCTLCKRRRGYLLYLSRVLIGEQRGQQEIPEVTRRTQPTAEELQAVAEGRAMFKPGVGVQQAPVSSKGAQRALDLFNQDVN